MCSYGHILVTNVIYVVLESYEGIWLNQKGTERMSPHWWLKMGESLQPQELPGGILQTLKSLCAREQIHAVPIASTDFSVLVLNAFRYLLIRMKQNPGFNSLLTLLFIPHGNKGPKIDLPRRLGDAQLIFLQR